jgi:hypothetical protein
MAAVILVKAGAIPLRADLVEEILQDWHNVHLGHFLFEANGALGS